MNLFQWSGGDVAWDTGSSFVSSVDPAGGNRDCAGSEEFESQGSESVVDNRCHRAEYCHGSHRYPPFIPRLKPGWNDGRLS